MDFKRLRDRLHEIESETWDTIRAAAKDGDAEAQFLLGYRFSDARLDCEDSEDCEKWLRAAAEQDHPEALYELALTRFGAQIECGDHVLDDARYKLLLRAASLGSVNAQRDVAVLYIWGDNPFFEKDWTRARFWYLQAARQGHQEAQAAVGSMIVRGEGGPVNQEAGLAILELAANGPTSYEAQTAAEELALYYSGAFGVPPNPERERKWREKVTRNNENECL